MTRALASILLATAMLAACAPTAVATRPASYPVPGSAALGNVLGQNATGLSALFGQPAADIREGQARKLQFGNATCVLDAYLYPHGSTEPVVTYLDARQTDGSPIDRASCVGALQASRAGRR